MPDFPATANPNQLNGLNITLITKDENGQIVIESGPDFDGDGVPDTLFGLPSADTPGGVNSGRFFVVGVTDYGARPETLDLDVFIPPQNQADPLIQSFFAFSGYGGGANFNAGVSVAVGDVNGDGRPDIITGAPGAGGGSGLASFFLLPEALPTAEVPLGDLDGTDGSQVSFFAFPTNFQGGVRVASGDLNDDGFADIIAATPGRNSGAGGVTTFFGSPGPFDPTLDASTINGTNGFNLTGFGAGDAAGGGGLATGDFNGDGVDDIAVAARFADPSSRPDAGSVTVLFGTPGGFPANFDITTLDGTNGFTIIGGFAGQQLGWSLASAGDFNGDGIDDIIAGAPPTNNFAGAAALIFGHSGPFDPFIDVGTLDGTNGFLISGILQNDSTGVSVAGGFDANGDGFADVVIGAADTDGPGNAFDAGSGFVLFGRPTSPGPALDLSTLDGTNGFRFDFLDPGFRNGIYVSTTDLDGDGLGDTFIGNQTNGNGTLIYGVAPTEAVIRNGSAANQTIFGSPFADELRGDGGDDILNGRDGGDLLEGGDGNDAGLLYTGGDVFNGGAGIDTAVILGTGGGIRTETFTLDIRETEVTLVPSLGDPRFFVPPPPITPYQFELIIPDESVIAGSRLEVIATGLGADEGLGIDASAVNGGGVWIFAGPGANMHVGGGGSDAALYSTPFLAGNTFDGGAGIDSLGFRGNYIGGNAVVFQDDSLTNVEALVALSGLDNPFGGVIDPNGFDYEFTLANGNVPFGGQLDVVGTSLGPNETLTVDGSLVGGTLRFFGGDGADVFIGGISGDLFYGGLGGDVLDGDAGPNIYAYLGVMDSAPGDADLLIWNNGDGSDLIDLERVDADATQDGNQNFNFIGADTFGNTPGQLRAFQVNGNDWRVEGDVNGDGVADLLILVETPVPLTEGVFVG